MQSDLGFRTPMHPECSAARRWSSSKCYQKSGLAVRAICRRIIADRGINPSDQSVEPMLLRSWCQQEQTAQPPPRLASTSIEVFLKACLVFVTQGSHEMPSAEVLKSRESRHPKHLPTSHTDGHPYRRQEMWPFLGLSVFTAYGSTPGSRQARVPQETKVCSAPSIHWLH